MKKKMTKKQMKFFGKKKKGVKGMTDAGNATMGKKKKKGKKKGMY